MSRLEIAESEVSVITARRTAARDPIRASAEENGAAEDAQTATDLQVFLINLDDAADKRTAMERQLHDLKIPFRRLPAVNGLELTEEQLLEVCDQEYAHRTLGRRLGRTEIGCYLSHLEIYKIMERENIPSALILEDDVLISEDLPRLLREWKRFPGHCRALQLVPTTQIDPLQKSRFVNIQGLRLPADYAAAWNHDICYGTAAYIIRLSYARELLRVGLPIKVPIDSLLYDWRYNLYIPWILYKEQKNEEGVYSTAGRHQEQYSQIEKERNILRKNIPQHRHLGKTIKRKINSLLHAFFRDFKKITPLPLNRGKKKSLLEIPFPHTLGRYFQIMFSCMVVPGRDGYAEIARAKKTPPVFLINMKTDKTRYRFMKKQLDEMNVPFETIEAEDGETIPAEELNRIYDPEISRKKFQRELLPGEIGCYLSHIKAYRLMLERNISEAVILEDDVSLTKEFAEVINSCQLPEECPVLQLVSGADINRSQRQHFSPYRVLSLPNGYQITPHIGVVYGTQAYMIRQSYARRLLREANSIQVPIDVMLFHWKYNFQLPWVICRKNSTKAKNGVSTLGKHEAHIGNKPIAYADIWSTKFFDRVRRWVLRNALLLLNGCILRWLWPWNYKGKASLLQSEEKPGVLQYWKIVFSCYFFPRIFRSRPP